MPEADVLLTNCSELATPVGEPPFCGERLRDVRVIREGKVAFKDGRIAAVGSAQEMAGWDAAHVVDCYGGTVVPGLVDAHTHLVWAGARVDELVMKLEGRSYQEIMAAGGGIHSTVERTRRARPADLLFLAKKRLDRCLANGTTTLEAKSGYGLDLESELKLLRVVKDLDAEHPVDLVSTQLGAHAIPRDASDRAAYLDMVCDELTPRAAKEGLSTFVDAFVDEGALTVEEGRQVLEAGRERGQALRVHADELACTRATRMALDVGGCKSFDHLNVVHDEDITALGADDPPGTATLCPVTPFTSSVPYAPARRLVDAGAPVALGSDLNPNAWNEGMLLTLALAVHQMRLLPSEALTAATANSAWSLGLEDRGRLEPGLVGDAVVLDVPRHEYVGYKVAGIRPRVVVKGGAVVVGGG